MKILSTILAAGAFLVLGTGVAAAQQVYTESSKTGLPFLRVAPSAATAAMAGSGAAMTGPSAQWLNPALLAFRPERTAQFSHLQFGEGITQEFASVSGKTGIGYLGVSAQIYDSGDIEGRSDTGSPTGVYSIKYASLALAYARQITGDLAIGVTYKTLMEKIAEENANGYAVDAGISWRTPVRGLSAGAAVRNLGHMGQLMSERTKLPTDGSVGIFYRGTVPNFGSDYSFTADYVAPRYGSRGVRLGMEVEPVDRFYVRAGYRSDSDFENFSAGVGLTLGMFMADVSYTPMTELSNNALRFTLSLAGF